MLDDGISMLLGGIEVYGTNSSPFAVAQSMPIELVRRLQSAVEAFEQGYSGIDYVLKTYADEWDLESHRQTERALTTNRLIQQALTEVEEVVSWWTSTTKRPNPLGLFAAGSALQRSQASFSIAALLARLGYRYECFAILRLILEQIAWAYAVKAEGEDTVFTVSVTRSISVLRELIPEAGPLYGELSDLAHIHPEISKEYIDVSTPQYLVTLRSTGKWSTELAWSLAHVAHLYCVVTEAVFMSTVSGATRVERLSDGTMLVRSGLSLRKLLDENVISCPYRRGSASGIALAP